MILFLLHPIFKPPTVKPVATTKYAIGQVRNKNYFKNMELKVEFIFFITTGFSITEILKPGIHKSEVLGLLGD